MFSSKFRLNRLRRSFSSWPNPLIGFQHFACIWACKICSSSATTHSPCFIVEFRHFQLVPHFVPKLCLQRSYFQSFTFHTAYLWTTSVSISVVFSAALFFSFQPACSSLARRLWSVLRNQLVAGASLDARTLLLHLESSIRSLLLRTFGMLRLSSNSSKLPYKTFSRNNIEHRISDREAHARLLE